MFDSKQETRKLYQIQGKQIEVKLSLLKVAFSLVFFLKHGEYLQIGRTECIDGMAKYKKCDAELHKKIPNSSFLEGKTWRFLKYIATCALANRTGTSAFFVGLTNQMCTAEQFRRAQRRQIQWTI